MGDLARTGSARNLAMALTAIYLATLIIAPSNFGPTFVGVVWSPARISLVLLAVVALATGLLNVQTIRDQPRSVLVSWVAFLVVAAATTVLNPSGPAFSRLASMALEGLLLYLLVQAVVVKTADVRSILKVAVAATTFVAIVSLLLSRFDLRYDSALTSLTGGSIGPNLGGDRFGIARQQGSFPAALFFGTWLASCSVLALPWTRAREPLTRRVAWSVWLVLCGSVVLLTASRIATTAMFASAAAFLWFQSRRVLAMLALVASVFTAVGFAALSSGSPPPPPPAQSPGIVEGASATPATAGPQYPSESDILAGSTDLRLKALQATLKAVLEKPVFGWGLLSGKQVVTTVGGSTNYVDSAYLVIVVEMGLAGLAAFLALLLSIAWQARRVSGSPEGLASTIAAGSIAAISVFAAFLQITQGYALFTVLIALVAISARRPAHVSGNKALSEASESFDQQAGAAIGHA